jgi:predicted amidohydrolase
MQVSILQLGMTDRSKAANLRQALEMVDRSPASDLLMLPEIWPIGFFSFDRYRAESETISGPVVSAFQDKAHERRCHILMGSFVEKENDSYYNTTLLLDPMGQIIARYRKIHLFGYQSEEKRILKPGAEIVVADTPWGLAGFSTCYDLRFPELFRAMVDRGAKIFMIPSAWPLARLNAWLLFNRARAHENLSYLFSCNCAGRNGSARFAGHSMVIDPMGKVIAEGGEDEEIVTAEIDPDEVDSVRGEFPALSDRRPGRFFDC